MKVETESVEEGLKMIKAVEIVVEEMEAVENKREGDLDVIERAGVTSQIVKIRKTCQALVKKKIW